MKPLPSARLATWLTEPLDLPVRRSVRRLQRQKDVVHVALMPDVHLATDVCVGAVVATRRQILPAAVGSDIGCGMASVALQADADLLSNQRSASLILSTLYDFVPSNRMKTAAALPAALQDSPLSSEKLMKRAQRDGRVQLGTLGRGNHFLEFQADQEGRLWVMVHSGSRAMGQEITKHHLGLLAPRAASALVALDLDSKSAADYVADVQWARLYASENRLAMLHAVESLMARRFQIQTDWSTLIQSDHNHVQREQHGGAELWVHRKGAQRAAAGEIGIVPGSMGTESFHIVGRGCPESLNSCSHGAGRRFSRAEASRRIKIRTLTREMSGVWFNERQARRLLDEAPSAYKDVWSVMRAQRELAKIRRTLIPLLSYKGVGHDR